MLGLSEPRCRPTNGAIYRIPAIDGSGVSRLWMEGRRLYRRHIQRVSRSPGVAYPKAGDEMQRRTFLKHSAVGIGTLAGGYGGVLKADGANLYQSPLMAQVLNRDRLGGMESTGGINAVVLKSPWGRSRSLDDMLAITSIPLY